MLIAYFSNSGHHFYVDTRANPPRSIWQHPYDVEEEWTNPNRKIEGQHPQAATSAAGGSRPQVSSTQSTEKASLGVRLKDKLTGTTHEEREKGRRERYHAQLKAEQAYLERRKQLMAQRAQLQAAYPQQYGYGRSPYVSSLPIVNSLAHTSLA